MADPAAPVIDPLSGWVFYTVATTLGFVGSGITVGSRLARGEKLNVWGVATTLVCGATAGGTATKAMIEFWHIDPFWYGVVAVLLGVLAMGFVTNALDGKIPLLNRFMGGKKDENAG